MTRSELPLGELSRSELEYLRNAIAKHLVPAPVTKAALMSKGKGALYARLGPLTETGQVASLALIDLALAIGSEPATPPAARPAVLAWTIEDGTLLNRGVRATTAVVLDLLASAQQHVLIAGYEFNHGGVIFQPLHQAMTERGVRTSIYLDVKPAPSPSSNLDAYLAVKAHQFLASNWRFGPPFPELHYWPAGCAHGSKCSLHAKCIVVDRERVLVGSANFTRRGYKHNLEVGVVLDERELGAALVRQFEHLSGIGVFKQMPSAVAAPAMPPLGAEDEGEGDRVATSATEVQDPVALADELLVTVAARPLFARIVAAGLPIPDVGDDVEGEEGEVIGSCELSWEEHQVAVLLPEQEGSRKKLEAAGWTCFAVDLDDASFQALSDLLRREG